METDHDFIFSIKSSESTFTTYALDDTNTHFYLLRAFELTDEE
jgi:hypothetical protein